MKYKGPVTDWLYRTLPIGWNRVPSRHLGGKWRSQGSDRSLYDMDMYDMEFVTNFTRTHVFEKSFTSKYSVNYKFLCQEENLFYP